MKQRALPLAVLALALLPVAATGATRADDVRAAARAEADALRVMTAGQLAAHVSPDTGAFDFARAVDDAVLALDRVTDPAPQRALAFLARHGALIGMSEAEKRGLLVASNSTVSRLQLSRVDEDALGFTHVRLDQTYRGLPVLGAQVIVHMNRYGITAVNGNYVPDIAVDIRPRLDARGAQQAARETLDKKGTRNLRAEAPQLGVYRTGLLEGFRGRSVLAWSVEVSGSDLHERVWIDAQTGAALISIPLRHSVLNRIVYSPQYNPASPDSFVVRREGDPTVLPPPSNGPDNLYHYTGQTYNIFRSAFGRDSYDGIGTEPQRTVLLANDRCPNAYWDGSTTNYCPDLDKDDVVAHEWGHAYTQHTHGLIYVYQAGALNESYSDFYGEALDLHNGVDGAGGPNNSRTTTYRYDQNSGQYVVDPPDPANGTRWRVGEDVQGLSQPAALGILRDMWFPDAFGDPDSVSSPLYHCGADDNGGVHVNSGVPNHAFAMLADGKTFNGVTVTPIGFTRVLHIYYRAMTAYQVSTTNFTQHEQALRASCADLVGAPINNFSTNSATSTVSTDVITAETCQQVANAMAAVEMSQPPVQCNFKPLLDANVPAQCESTPHIYLEDWETGMDGWTLVSEGKTGDWPGTNWELLSPLPDNRDESAHPGTAAYAFDSRGGTCSAGGDISGRFWLESPEITLGSTATEPKLTFEHLVQTEIGFDGGNLKLSVNGGAFALPPASAYSFNAPPGALIAAATNTNPLAGQAGWTGVDPPNATGSWGTTVLDLTTLTEPGDKIKIRFDYGQDGCGGNFGWLVDRVRVVQCPAVKPLPDRASCTVPGVPILADASGDALTSQQGHDIEKLSIAEPAALGAGKMLFTLKMAGLQSLPPNTIWPIQFASHTGTQTSVRMDNTTGAVRFTVATGPNSTNPALNMGAPADAASSYDPDGTIRIVVTRASIGGPTTGDKLSQFLIRVRVQGGAITPTPDNAPNDVAPTGSYIVAGSELFCTQPIAELGATPTSGVAPLEVVFTVSGRDATGAIADTFTLDFGDGQKLENQAFGGEPSVLVPHAYTSGGVYTARLTVTDANDLVSTPAEQAIRVTAPGTAAEPATLDNSRLAGALPAAGLLLLSLTAAWRRRRLRS